MTRSKYWISKIRNKSDKEKILFSLTVSLGITGVIFGVWLLSFITVGPFSNVQIKEEAEPTNEASLLEGAKDIFKSLKNFGKETYYFE